MGAHRPSGGASHTPLSPPQSPRPGPGASVKVSARSLGHRSRSVPGPATLVKVRVRSLGHRAMRAQYKARPSWKNHR